MFDVLYGLWKSAGLFDGTVFEHAGGVYWTDVSGCGYWVRCEHGGPLALESRAPTAACPSSLDDSKPVNRDRSPAIRSSNWLA